MDKNEIQLKVTLTEISEDFEGSNKVVNRVIEDDRSGPYVNPFESKEQWQGLTDTADLTNGEGRESPSVTDKSPHTEAHARQDLDSTPIAIDELDPPSDSTPSQKMDSKQQRPSFIQARGQPK